MLDYAILFQSTEANDTCTCKARPKKEYYHFNQSIWRMSSTEGACKPGILKALSLIIAYILMKYHFLYMFC